MKKRRLLSILALAVALAVMLVPLFAAVCYAVGKCPPDQHAWVWEETVQPTCTEAGYDEYICSKCHDIKHDFIPATGRHDWGKWEYTDETIHTRKCKSCGTEDNESHRWIWESNSEGYHWRKCPDCGAQDSTNKHNWDDSNWHSDKDNHWHECTECKEQKDKSGHTLVWKSDDTKHWQECSVCGYKDESSEDSHSYSESIYRFDDEYDWPVCDTCGYESITDKQKHAWDEGTVEKEPTSTEEGTKKYTCRFCGHTKTEAIPKLSPTPTPVPGIDPEGPSVPSPTPAAPTGVPAAPTGVPAAPAATPTITPIEEPVIAPSAVVDPEGTTATQLTSSEVQNQTSASDAVAAAFKSLLEKNDALRTAFESVDYSFKPSTEDGEFELILKQTADHGGNVFSFEFSAEMLKLLADNKDDIPLKGICLLSANEEGEIGVLPDNLLKFMKKHKLDKIGVDLSEVSSLEEALQEKCEKDSLTPLSAGVFARLYTNDSEITPDQLENLIKANAFVVVLPFNGDSTDNLAACYADAGGNIQVIDDFIAVEDKEDENIKHINVAFLGDGNYFLANQQ